MDVPTLTFRAVAAASRPVVRRRFDLDARGIEHLPRGGFVLCANHVSALDAWALSAPLYPRQPRYMAKAELFARPVLRSLLRRIGLFPVARGRCCVTAIATAIGHARAGRIVVIFPEGSRRKESEQPEPRAGAAFVALAADVPLVPAAVSGTAHPLGRWRVAFGAPVDVADLAGTRTSTAAREATRRLWRRIAELEEELSCSA
jgi:1-acyl-sn-glycerol-3-phosphate acyltransferase